MAYVAVDKNGTESIYPECPERTKYGTWVYEESIECTWIAVFIILPRGSIYKLIGRELTWEDEPVEL